MSHIRGVKVEKRIIVPMLHPNAAPNAHQYRALGACATSRGDGQSIAAFWNHMESARSTDRAYDAIRWALQMNAVVRFGRKISWNRGDPDKI
jgi:hypothetical protein